METPTPFSDVFNLFLSQVTDYELTLPSQLSGELTAEEELMKQEFIDTLEDNMKLWLRAALTRFTMIKKDVDDVNWEDKQFNVTLKSNEQYILAKCMVLSYLDIHVISEGNIKQALNSKDYRMYSPANQLKALLELQAHINNDLNSLMSRYSWSIDSIRGRFK